MLKDATGFKKIYIAAGKTDLRKGMDSLAAIVSLQFELDPYETDILFLFCGSTRRLIKGLVWEGDGFVLLSKRLQNGVFQWPRDRQEVMDLTQKQFSDLMNGLSIVAQGVQPLVRNEVTQSSPDIQVSGLSASQSAHTGLPRIEVRP